MYIHTHVLYYSFSANVIPFTSPVFSLFLSPSPSPSPLSPSPLSPSPSPSLPPSLPPSPSPFPSPSSPSLPPSLPPLPPLQFGLTKMLQSEQGLTVLVSAMDPYNENMMADVLRVTAAVCLVADG